MNCLKRPTEEICWLPVPKNDKDGPDLQTSVAGMGWLRLVGSWKLQVSFAKEPYKRNLLICLINRSRIMTNVSVKRWMFQNRLTKERYIIQKRPTKKTLSDGSKLVYTWRRLDNIRHIRLHIHIYKTYTSSHTWDIFHEYVKTFITYMSRRLHVCVKTSSCMCQDVFMYMYMSRRLHAYVCVKMCSCICICQDVFMYMSRRLHVCVKTSSCICQDT